jgi:hypothetical protein
VAAEAEHVRPLGEPEFGHLGYVARMQACGDQVPGMRGDGEGGGASAARMRPVKGSGAALVA